MLPKSKTLKRDFTEIRTEREENIPLDIFSDEPACRVGFLYELQIEKSGAYDKASVTACRCHSGQQDLSRKDSEFSRVDESLPRTMIRGTEPRIRYGAGCLSS